MILTVSVTSESVHEKDRQNIIQFIKNAYYAYFDVKLVDQDKSWAQHKVCITCMSTFSL